MQGMRLFAGFLKVNPYFTLAMAVGFSGMAAIGVRHIVPQVLNSLIPLQIQSSAPDLPGDSARQEVDGPGAAYLLGQAGTLRRMHPAQPSGDGAERAFAQSLPTDPPYNPWQDISVARFGDPFWTQPAGIAAKQPDAVEPVPPKLDWSDSPQFDPSVDPSWRAPTAPRASMAGPPQVGTPGAVGILLPPMPLAPDLAITLAAPLTLLVPPAEFLAGPAGLQMVGAPAIEASEPPLGTLFLGLLALLAGLRRWRRQDPAPTVS